MNYLIGDIQGCCDALQHLLMKIDFSPSRDHLYALGDLVNRGPESLRTLQTLQNLQGSATCLLGNHDLHLLAAAHGVRHLRRGDTVQDILSAPDSQAQLDWLRHQKLAIYEQGWLMVHAGVPPQWTLDTTLAVAAEVQTQLQSPGYTDFLNVMYGNEPSKWDDTLTGPDRWRFTVNALTRIRFVTLDGSLELKAKKPPEAELNLTLSPWFEAPNRQTQNVPIAFGHWSTLGLINRENLMALDTGCVWGGQLTAVRLNGADREVIQIECEQAQTPGIE
jgi:bis(5'-nucleosyl)-tetraphosphatase (symmetrical)